MKVLLLAAMLTVVALSASSRYTPQELKEWELFKIEHKKEYATEEEETMRRSTFVDNLRSVKEHNIRHDKGEVSHKAGINAYSDMTLEEMKATMLNCRKRSKTYKSTYDRNTSYEYTHHQVPETVDWRKKGAVTKVKDQGLSCGSCWAFAATGSLEGMNFVKTGKLVSLSEQNLVDCDNLDEACEGGIEEHAYTFISKNGGIDTEASYPYTGTQEECKYKADQVGATVSSYVNIPSGAEEQIKQVVATKGPVTVAVDADLFTHYHSDVFENCTKEVRLNHAVVVVGYGTTDDGKDYWLIKNSWGTTWGMNGYMKLARGKNMCGVAQEAVYPIV